MQKFLKEYLEGLNERRAKRRKIRIAELLLVVLVIGTVAGVLSQYGLTLTDAEKCGLAEHKHNGACYENRLVCGKEETEAHEHTDECYETADILVCGLDETEGHQHDESCYDEEGNLICEKKEMEPHHHDESCYTEEHTLICQVKSGESHKHTDECYERTLICGMEEHEHDASCYIDKTADVEELSVWDDMYANTEWRDTWSENLVIAAEKQLAYKESKDNYEVAEDGSHKGYTRYGAFCEDDYCDWDAAFVNFCMHYAGKDDINIEASKMFPKETDAQKWYDEFVKADEGNKDFLMAPAGYEPKAGDLIFFEQEDEEAPLRMGIVSDYDAEKNEFSVIEGNRTDEVKENTYKIKEQAQGVSEETATVDVVLTGTVAEEETVVALLDMMAAEEAYKASPEAYSDEAEEEIRELTTDVDDTTITLSGPVSSFEEGVEYTLQAEKVENEETIATVEEAVNQVAEEKETTVENYQAYDIKLMVDGEEVQPIGPVAVKFSGREVAASVENEGTEVNVIHVDESTGETTDMEAVATEESDVVIETEHFSVYVYVEFGGIEGVDVNIQHWGENIVTVDSTHKEYNRGEKGANVIPDDKALVEEAFNIEAKSVVTTSAAVKLYTTDENFHIPNESYLDISQLSKVYVANNQEGASSGYKIKKIWVSRDSNNGQYGEDVADWEEGTYDEYLESDLTAEDRIELGEEVRGQITEKLKNGSVIRFWYEPIEGTEVKEPVTFYDYDISDGLDSGTSGTYRTEEKGINAPENFDQGKNGPKFGVGQQSGGNASSWATNTYGGRNLNGANYTDFTVDGVNVVQKPLTGIVKKQLVNGQLQFIDAINAPSNLFSHNPSGGSYQYDDYQLGFRKNGDTYTLNNVYKGGVLTTGARNLTSFDNSMINWKKNMWIFSNEFWPLDDVEHKKDPLMGNKTTNESITLVDKNGNKVMGPANSDFSNGGHNGNHNFYFGMTYEVTFEVGDYTGPMEYYFRGDDDFWLFLDGELVVDLGGVHTAMSKVFDLRGHLAEQVSQGAITMEQMKGQHTLKVFYMERGASGSCCYMQFTLPRAQINPLPTPETTIYSVDKKWVDYNNRFRPHEIEVTLYKKKESGNGVTAASIRLPLRNEEGEYVDANGNPITDDDPKKYVWSYTWTNLPKEDGKTHEKNIYYAEEQRIDPTNESNPMLGYECSRVETVSNTAITITNTIVDKKIKIHKLWEGDEKELANRPDKVTFQLYANGVEYKDLEGNPVYLDLTKDNNWTNEYHHVPEYYFRRESEDSETGTWEKVEYSVKEVSDKKGEIPGKNGAIYNVKIQNIASGAAIDKNYVASGEAIDYIAFFEATNTLVSKNVCIEKVSKNVPDTKLAGAEFHLYKEEDFETTTPGENDNTTPQGISIGSLKPNVTPQGIYKTGENGRIDIQGLRFYPSTDNPTGTAIYYLVETKAPEGYFLSEMPIKLVVDKNGVTVDFQKSDWENNDHILFDGEKYTIQIPNEIIYELPEAGGNGIYLYMFSGMLLMLGASLLAYKNKRKEVLRR